MRISDWSSDVCSSDLIDHLRQRAVQVGIVAKNGEGDGAQFQLGPPQACRLLYLAPDLGAAGKGEEAHPRILQQGLQGRAAPVRNRQETAGMPASSSACASLQAVAGVLLDGFRITALPAAKAGAI